MTRKLQFIAAGMLGALMCLPAVSMAGEGHQWKQGSGSDHHYRGGHTLEKMQKHLELDDQQTEKLKKLFADKDSQLKPVRQDMQTKRKQIQEMVHSGKLDDARLSSLAEDIGKLKARSIIIRSKSQAAVLQVLTDRQRQKYRDYWTKKYSHRKSLDGKDGHGHSH